MNEAKEFLREGILMETSLAEEMKKIEFSLAPVMKQLGITFLSKKEISSNAEKIRQKLELLKGLHSDNEKGKIEQAINYFNSFIPKRTQKEEKEDSDIRIINSWDIPSKKVSVEDFVKYFQARFTELKGILRDHGSLANLTSISKISSQKQDLSVIGIVYSKRVTKNKNVILEIEDMNGKIPILIHHSREELISKSKSIVLDEVIGVSGNGNSEIIFANDVIFPEMSESQKRHSEEEKYAVFTSDIHLGSNKFIEDKFLNFLSWLNGEVGSDEQKEMSRKIRYLFITGDTVDGVGVYPGQSERLNIQDVRLQYKKLAEYLGKIRKDISIFLCPGQHDASRIAEPQPPIEKEYAEDLYSMENLHLVSNPALVEIARHGGRGIKVLMYHGASFHSMIDDIEELRLSKAHDNPTKVSKVLLRKRHLAPQHSTTDHLPVTEIDPLVIREVPDVFATGDLHRSEVSFCGPVLLIASSCWQHMTEFEEKVGNHPDPCKVPILNLKTGKVSIIDFS